MRHRVADQNDTLGHAPTLSRSAKKPGYETAALPGRWTVVSPRARRPAMAKGIAPPEPRGGGPANRPPPDPGAPRPQDVDDRPPGGVAPDVAKRQLGVRMSRPRDQPEGGSRDVARNPPADRLHRRPSFETDRD